MGSDNPGRRGGHLANPEPWYRIEHAVWGYVELVRNREQGKRELIDGPRDRKATEEAKKDLAAFSARFEEQKKRNQDR